jgi:hypothetical protein
VMSDGAGKLGGEECFGVHGCGSRFGDFNMGPMVLHVKRHEMTSSGRNLADATQKRTPL